jgi:hypothetical protein
MPFRAGRDGALQVETAPFCLGGIYLPAAPEHARDAATLFEKANGTLDRARNAGRNPVRLAE